MKKIFQLSVLVFVLLLAFDNDATAQRSKKKKKETETDEYFDEGGSWKHKLWYGTGFDLGYSGGSGGNNFRFGLSPMVGYKITENFSVGPRLALTYNNYKFQSANGVLKANLLSWDVGVFSRYKILPFLFAHIEYQFENATYLATDNSGYYLFDTNTNKLITEQEKRNNFLVGLGYSSSSGGFFGYEVLILYNTTLPENVIESPFIIRVGFTYNF